MPKPLLTLIRYRPRLSGPVRSGLRTKATGKDATAGCRVVASLTSDPAGVIGRPPLAVSAVFCLLAEDGIPERTPTRTETTRRVIRTMASFRSILARVLCSGCGERLGVYHRGQSRDRS